MLARDPDPPWRTKTTVSRDARRRTEAPVLDHLLLFQDADDAPCTALTTAMPLPMPSVALLAMATIVIRDLPLLTMTL